jgi:hypothetical protein
VSSAFLNPDRAQAEADIAELDDLVQHPAERPLSRSDEHNSLDDLEIALRKLPGVRSVGFITGADLTMVQLHIDDSRTVNTVPMQAARLAYRHAPGSVAVEVVRWRSTGSTSGADTIVLPGASGASISDEEMRWIEPRVQIERVALSDDGLDVEVVLSFGSQRVIRKATISEGLVGVAAATVSALREFVGDIDYEPAWAHVVRPHPDAERMVAIGLEDDVLGEVRTGIAAGATPPEAAVRATMQALNRTLAARLPVLVAD